MRPGPPATPERFEDLPESCNFLSALVVIDAGTHTMYAASRDAAGNVERPVVSRTFRILATPRTTITGGPSGSTWVRDPRFTFVTTIPGSRFECRVDDAAWAPCTPPHQTAPLASGTHTFAVRAISPRGAVERAPPIPDVHRRPSPCGSGPIAPSPGSRTG